MLDVPQGEYIVMLDLPAEAKGTKALANETAQAAVERATKAQAERFEAKGMKVRQ
ncbi:hypothetical protein [Kytococcus aerolatus]|uniref:hypothetical protein n=1 Tax=Kytococcus aerolatus TaxID=592308 RepID=UPI0013568267|nr:hypothetical protein [Kytococcus aerolatus]